MTTYEFVKVRKSREGSTSTLLDNVCVCCLNKNIALIPMRTCKHADIINEILHHKLESSELWICQFCHQMMKKYSEFKQQVLSSYRIFTSMSTAKNLNVKQAIHLSTTKTKTIDFTFAQEKQPKIAEQKKKQEKKYLKDEDIFLDEINSEEILIDSTDVFTNNDIEIDIKIERETEQTNPLELPSFNKPSGSKVQKHKRHLEKTKDLIKEGMIILKVLNQEEFELDRRSDALKPIYVKLPYKCEDCLLGFDFQQTLDEHLEKRHNKNIGSHQCGICKTYFDSGYVYNEHMARHYRRFQCTNCHKIFRSKQIAINHYEGVHEDVKREYRCENCDFVTDSVRKFNYHNEKHKGRHQCADCDKSFVTKQGLKSHLFLIHKQSDRTYSCDRCDKTFSSRSGLAHHVTSHTDNRTAFCVTCKKVYASEHSLASHLMHHKAHRSEQSNRFICEECGDKFPTKSQLREHIEWTHLKIIRYRCDVCGKAFRYKRLIKRHKAYVHEKQKPVKNQICDYCGAAFSTQRILTVHIRTHTGDRPLQCTVCPATFAHPAALFNHNKIHK